MTEALFNQGKFPDLRISNLNLFRRKIYLATDEPAVLEEALQNYPDYEWLYHHNGKTKSGIYRSIY
jgi:hypothetical protein